VHLEVINKVGDLRTLNNFYKDSMVFFSTNFACTACQVGTFYNTGE
jgi:hypothetical protein